MAGDVSIATVKNCFGHGAGPSGIYAQIERVHVNPGLLAIVRESGTMQCQEMTDEVHVRIVVEADAENRQALRCILFAQFDEHWEFVTAWLAPRRPESDEQRLAAVFREHALIAIEVNQCR